MTELSPKARALIELGRTSLRPTRVDRERIEAALQAKLASPAAPTPLSVTRGLSWQVLTGAALGICLLGAASVRVLMGESREPTLSSRAQQAEVVRPSPSVLAELPPPAADASLAPPPNEPPPAAKTVAPSTRDRLSIEVELLSRATHALREGDASAALTVLNQHQRRFPKGKLRLERRIAKARALCTLGRVEEGRAELHDLPSDAPATARALKVCGL